MSDTAVFLLALAWAMAVGIASAWAILKLDARLERQARERR